MDQSNHSFGSSYYKSSSASSSSFPNGFSSPHQNGSYQKLGDASSKQGFGSAPTSHLPASLGLGNVSDGSHPRILGDRPRLFPQPGSSSSLTSSRSSDGLRFAPSSVEARAANGSRPSGSIPSWSSHPSTSARTPIPGLPAGSQPVDSLATTSASRNFLVPIGATGARQKLSIATASQRRRLAASVEVRWPSEVAGSTDNANSLVASTENRKQGSGNAATALVRSQSTSQDIDAGPPSNTLASMSRSASYGDMATTSVGARDRVKEFQRLRTAEQIPTSTELVQQAAMQRLSSRSILPTLRNNGSVAASSREKPKAQPSTLPISSPFSSSTAVSALPSDSRYSSSSGSLRPRQSSSDRSTIRASQWASSSTSKSDATTPTSPASPTNLNHVAPKTSATKLPLADGLRGDAHVAGSSPSRPLTLAESYKQSMLERDLQSSRSSTGAASSTIAAPSLPRSAPLLDLNLPSSSFFFNDAEESKIKVATLGSAASSRPKSNTVSSIEDELGGKGSMTSTTEESDTSIGSFEGAYDYSGSNPSGSLQSSYDEAMAIQDRLRSGVTDEPEYGGLFEPLRKSADKMPDPARSYLAFHDDDDDGRLSPTSGHNTPKMRSRATVPTRASLSPSETQTRTPGLASPTSSQTPTDRSTSLPSSGVLNRKDLGDTEKNHSRNGPIDPLATASLKEDTATRSPLPRQQSLQTLRLPPNKLENEPGPKEEAALEAAAQAANPKISPRSASSPRAATRDADVSPTSTSPFQTSNANRRDGNGLGLSSASASNRPGQEEGDDLARWRRSHEAFSALSPVRQSRFSEASTDLSDSRAPTRTENRFSGMESDETSDDGMEDESNDGHMLPTSAWNEVDNALRRFRDRSPNAPSDRGNLLRSVLLPFLALEAETVTVDVIGSGPYAKGKARRALFFDWIRYLLLELQQVQTSADRGAILESIACIIESRNFSVSILSADPEDEARFSSVFGHILSYAIGELNKKGVYQNTLIFSGRLLAVAFFRVEGVASKLLRALPVNRFALERVAKEFGWQRRKPSDFEKFANRFPASLRQLCYKDSRSYLKMLDNESSLPGATEVNPEDDRFLVRQPEVEVEMSGNWLRRWQSDDSELFFSFCRSYHRQLAGLFASSRTLESVSKHFFGGPGYAHLATCVHQKCLALVHRVILSVTTLSSQKNFNPAVENANVLSGSTAGKPRILEAANRRCTAIVVDIVRAPAGNNMIFAPMLGLHIKALVKRTSLYDVQGVFCLLDWLDGVISHMDSADLLTEGLVDVSFVITTIGMLLESADHALALMRTIAFCYANFGVLTATTENRVHFCEQILLKPSVFHKLFLSWSFTIRAYYLHLLVFRLARIRDFPNPKDDPNGRTAIRVVRLFNQRLEALRKRHDQLSPEIDSSSDDNKSEDGKSKKSGTSTFVSTIKRTSTDGVATEGGIKAEKLAALSPTDRQEATSKAEVDAKNRGQSKTKTWLKSFRSVGKPSNGKQEAANGSGSGANGRKAGSSPGTTVSPESDDEARTYGSNKTTPRTSFDSNSDAMSDASTLAGSVRGVKPTKLGAFEFEIKQQQPSQQQSVQQQQKSPNRSPPMPQSNESGHSPISMGHDAGIAKDTVFDLQSTHAHLPTPGRVPQSPRISRAFSRRASMLPGPASELVAGMLEGEDGEVPPVPEVPSQHLGGLGLSGMGGSGTSSTADVYEEALHVYAVQSLREYEQTVQEHDDFFSSLPEDQSAQVPRLPVNWPAMWSSTGE